MTYNDTLIKRSVEPDYRTEKSKTHVKIHNPLLQHDAKMQKHTNPWCCVVTEKLLNLRTDPIFIQTVLQPYLTKAPQHTAQLHTQEHKNQHFVCVFYQTKQNFFWPVARWSSVHGTAPLYLWQFQINWAQGSWSWTACKKLNTIRIPKGTFQTQKTTYWSKSCRRLQKLNHYCIIYLLNEEDSSCLSAFWRLHPFRFTSFRFILPPERDSAETSFYKSSCVF